MEGIADLLGLIIASAIIVSPAVIIGNLLTDKIKNRSSK